MKTVLFILSLTMASSLFGQHQSKSASPFSQSLTDAYLALQASLAQDDLSGAHDAALHYIAAFGKSTAALNIENLTRYANEIASAGDLHAARLSFKPLTEQAKMLFDYLASGESAPLYVARCSMAFDGQGAEWIQSSQEIANPYYGASMLKCGAITRSIGSTMTQPTTSASGCSHNGDSSQSCGHSNSSSCCSK